MSSTALSRQISVLTDTLRQQISLENTKDSDAFAPFLARHAPSYQRDTQALPSPSSTSWSQQTSEAIRQHKWHQVVFLTAQIITSEPDLDASLKNLVNLLQWWHLRLVTLWKLRCYSHAHTELMHIWGILDKVTEAEISFAVPFGLKVLRSQSLIMNGHPRVGVASLWQELTYCDQQVKQDTQTSLWSDRAMRIRLLLASTLVELHAYEAARHVLHPLEQTLLTKPSPLELHDAVCALHICRIHISMGSMPQAQCLLACAKQAPEAMYVMHDRAWQFLQDQPTKHNFEDFSKGDLSKPSQLSMNNLALANLNAISAFQAGDLIAGVDWLEHGLSTDPGKFSHSPGLLGNLLTFHAMGVNGHAADRRRIATQVTRVLWSLALGMDVFSLGASFVFLVLVLVAYWKRKWILAQLSEPTRHRIQAILGAEYSPLSRFDWNTAAEVGLTSALFDIEANIADGDTREGLDEHGMREVHRLMQEYNLVRNVY
ncbi:hypothetical protein MYAM1_002080 [Malassezia yamatoensis]|uniref:Uncharacterized protein n=1 Tax=Malassezia yamatoensis TaxID=253288 RepID=A0AAJ5YV90_9BASI|nr:hypothetical protein MYAM1_002080 [Malassezia yamatoensis]